MTKISASAITRVKKRAKQLVVASGILLWLLWVPGQVLRDSSWLSSLLFCIPSPALALLLLAGIWCAWRAGHRRVARMLAVLALVPTFFVLSVENRFFAERDGIESDTLRLVHWNVFNGYLGWDGIEGDLRRCIADLYVLSEIPAHADLPATAGSLGKGYVGIRFNNLAVLARGSLHDGKWLRREGGVSAYGLVWQSPQGSCRVLVVDMASSIFLAREPRLLAIRKLMIDWDADIIVGDFNAPRRSRSLSPLPPGFVHAYDTAGSGYSYTWPLPCPVYAIDQCILGSCIQPVTYDLESSSRSDHRRQVLEFMIQR